MYEDVIYLKTCITENMYKTKLFEKSNVFRPIVILIYTHHKSEICEIFFFITYLIHNY